MANLKNIACKSLQQTENSNFMYLWVTNVIMISSDILELH